MNVDNRRLWLSKGPFFCVLPKKEASINFEY